MTLKVGVWPPASPDGVCMPGPCRTPASSEITNSRTRTTTMIPNTFTQRGMPGLAPVSWLLSLFGGKSAIEVSSNVDRICVCALVCPEKACSRERREAWGYIDRFIDLRHTVSRASSCLMNLSKYSGTRTGKQESHGKKCPK